MDRAVAAREASCLPRPSRIALSYTRSRPSRRRKPSWPSSTGTGAGVRSPSRRGRPAFSLEPASPLPCRPAASSGVVARMPAVRSKRRVRRRGWGGRRRRCARPRQGPEAARAAAERDPTPRSAQGHERPGALFRAGSTQLACLASFLLNNNDLAENFQLATQRPANSPSRNRWSQASTALREASPLSSSRSMRPRRVTRRPDSAGSRR